eukprot:3538996-Prymnesium_polylepis.2
MHEPTRTKLEHCVAVLWLRRAKAHDTPAASPPRSFWLAKVSMHEPPPLNTTAFAAMMDRLALGNGTLLDYCFPSAPVAGAVFKHWSPYTAGCRVATDCYCFHVEGDMSSSRNPNGWKHCAKLSTIESCARDRHKRCACLTADEQGRTCLFSDSTAVALELTLNSRCSRCAPHDVVSHHCSAADQDPLGRDRRTRCRRDAHHRGGPLRWAVGADVTSLEFLPLSGATEGLARAAPPVRLVTGDGTIEVPRMLTQLSAAEAARTMVIFDGEKRFGAWRTFDRVRAHVALAVFDDTNVADGPNFKAFLKERGEVWWDTSMLPDQLFQRESAPLRHMLAPLNEAAGKDLKWHGGVNDLASFHFSIVRGDAWRPRHGHHGP